MAHVWFAPAAIRERAERQVEQHSRDGWHGDYQPAGRLAQAQLAGKPRVQGHAHAESRLVHHAAGEEKIRAPCEFA